jgi:hypothetical protein
MPAPYAAKPRVQDKPVSFSGAIFSIFSGLSIWDQIGHPTFKFCP